MQCLTFTDPAIKQYAHVWWDLNRDNCIDPDEAAAVTEIPYRAFYKNNALEHLDDLNLFPSLKTIREEAFAECPNLKTAVLSNIKSVEANAFYTCPNLKTIELSATSVDFTAFWGNNIDTLKLNHITSLPSNHTAAVKLENYSTSKCESSNAFATVVYDYVCEKRPDFLIKFEYGHVSVKKSLRITHHFKVNHLEFRSLDVLSQYQLAYAAISHIDLGDLSSIPNFAFTMSSVKTLDAPMLTSIGDGSFYNTPIITLNLPKVNIIGSGVFENSTLQSINIPNAIVIGSSAFSGCNGLSNIDLPQAKTIGSSAFSGCNGLSNIDLPQATTIDSFAFERCKNISEVRLPKANTLGDAIFYQANNLNNLILSTPDSIDYIHFYNDTHHIFDYHTFRNLTSSNVALTLNINKQRGGTSSPLVEEDEKTWADNFWKEIKFVE